MNNNGKKLPRFNDIGLGWRRGRMSPRAKKIWDRYGKMIAIRKENKQ